MKNLIVNFLYLNSEEWSPYRRPATLPIFSGEVWRLSKAATASARFPVQILRGAEKRLKEIWDEETAGAIMECGGGRLPASTRERSPECGRRRLLHAACPTRPPAGRGDPHHHLISLASPRCLVLLGGGHESMHMDWFYGWARSVSNVKNLSFWLRIIGSSQAACIC
jgi:hypothetical protein